MEPLRKNLPAGQGLARAARTSKARTFSHWLVNCWHALAVLK